MSHKTTLVTVDNKYIDLLINTSDAKEIIAAWFKDVDTENDVDYIPIDMTGLEHFIYSSEQKLNEYGHNKEYYEKVENNLRVAKQVRLVSKELHESIGQYVWPHVKKPSPYGRIYYHALSLQNCSKELRHAAIGKHYQYDLEAAVYAIRLMLAEDICTELGTNTDGLFTYTKEYLDQKSPIRNKLAKYIESYPDPVKLIKEMISAIGFGAKTHDFSWVDENGQAKHTAITYIIRNKTERQAILSDPWVIEFRKEQDFLTKMIATYWLQNESFVKKLEHVPNIKNNNGRFKHEQVIALLFQTLETKIIDEITADLDVVVRIHDAFVTKHRVDIVDLRKKLNNISQYLKIDCTEWGEFRTDYDSEEQQHKEFIRQQEIMVAKLHNTFVHDPMSHRIDYGARNIEGSYDGNGYNSNAYDKELDPFCDE